jgi:hypothetical protein
MPRVALSPLAAPDLCAQLAVADASAAATSPPPPLLGLAACDVYVEEQALTWLGPLGMCECRQRLSASRRAACSQS